MIRKSFRCLICLLMISLLLTSCYDGHEIGEFSYISIIGIEKGEKERFRFTFQIPLLTMGEEGKGKSEKSAESVTIEAPSLSNAIKLANTDIAKRLNFMHLKAIIISEDLAKSGKIGEYIAPIIRYREIRRNTIVIVCKGEAKEFVEKSEPYSGELISQTIEDVMRKSEETGFFPKVTLNDFYDGLKAPYHALMVTYSAISPWAKEEESKSGEESKQGQQGAGSKDEEKGKSSSEENSGKEQGKEDDGSEAQKEVGKDNNGDYYAGEIPRSGGEKIEHFGSVLFDGDMMVGKLTGFETQMVLITKGEIRTASFTIQDPIEPDQMVTLEVNEFESPETEIDLADKNKPLIKIKLKLEGSIMSIPSGINYEKAENTELLEKALEGFLADGIQRSFEKCKEAKTDVFNFGTVAVKNFLTIPEWEEYNWLTKFPESELKVEVDYTIRRTGHLIKTVPIFSTEGKE